MPDARKHPVPAIGRAPGKVILIGEHSVVYGEPAVVLPLPAVGIQVTATPVDGPLQFGGLGYDGPLDQVPELLAGLAEAVREACARLGVPASGLRLEVEAGGPIARGLGSSASAAVALVRAIYGAYGAPLDDDTLLALADVAERHAHGNPSGMDAATVAAGVPIWFRRGAPSEKLSVDEPFYFVVADTGESRNTKKAVAAVREHLDAEPAAARSAIERLGTAAGMVRRGLDEGAPSVVGGAMLLAQEDLESLGVSAPSLERLVMAALEAGALGAKLTGAGHGGCMVALAGSALEQETLMAALARAGAAQTWPLTLERTP